MAWSLIALTILCAALINRFRGGGVISADLPGHRRFWAAPLMAGLAALHLDWLSALLFGACWLLWAVLPWGRWYTLGRGDRDWSGKANWFEELIEGAPSFEVPAIDFGPAGSTGRIIDDHMRLSLRNLIALLPALFFFPPVFLIVLFGMSLAYEVAWRIIPEDRGPTGYAEWATGALWGLALVLAATA